MARKTTDREIVENNLGIVGKIVREYKCPDHLSKADLFQEGVIGLYNALQHYNHKKGIKFSSFAYTCVKNQINNFVRKNREMLFIEDLISDPVDAGNKIEDEMCQLMDISNSLAKLQKLEQQVMESIYYDDLTLQATGKKLGVSYSKVLRTRDKALKKLKKAV